MVNINKVAFICALLTISHITIAQESDVIKLEETIRANQEQPKVLSIVPWQSPKAKQALPSAIVERINKTFMPLQREELLRQIALVENKNTYPKP
jgi:hypothetical protein